MIAPTPFRWTGEAMEPLRGFAKRCDEAFVIGEVYPLAPVENRSAATHRHYFVAVNEAWENLPEQMAARFPTAEHLRKFALIKAGFADQSTFVAASKAEAVRLAAFLRPVDEFAVVTVSEATVTRWTAQSQSVRAMGAKPFQASKEAVLGVLSGMIGVEPAQLGRAA